MRQLNLRAPTPGPGAEFPPGTPEPLTLHQRASTDVLWCSGFKSQGHALPGALLD